MQIWKQIWMQKRRRLYEILEFGGVYSPLGSLIDWVMTGLILLNALAVSLETVPALRASYDFWFLSFEYGIMLLFSLEYGLRLWAAPEKSLREPAWKIRLEHILSPFALIDLLAILPFYFLNEGEWQAFLLLRFLRLLKLVRYSQALLSLGHVVSEERRALFAALIVMIACLFFSAAVMYLLEHEAQPDKFGTIPHALWWALATLTTVGYGDVVPVTLVGRFFGGVVMVFGLGLYALPIGIMASGFSEEISRRQFLIPPAMIKNLRLFEGLDEISLRDVASRLRTVIAPEHTVLVHRSDAENGLILFVSGSAHCIRAEGNLPLGEGDFLGSLSPFWQGERQLPALATSRVRLLRLSHRDMEMILSLYPEVAHNIERLSKQKLEALQATGVIEEAQLLMMIEAQKKRISTMGI